jgi:hypothetical protein
MKRLTAILLLIISLAALSPLPALLTGCGSTPAQITYDTLASVGAAVDAAMKGAAGARAQGQLTTDQWNKIAAKHAIYLAAYNTAIDAAAVALDKATVPANVAAAEQDLLALINQFLPKK